MTIWNKIKEFVNLTYVNPEVGRGFLTGVRAMGAFGIILCLLWFVGMCITGIPLWALIFDIAIIAFCGWAIVKAVIPWSKEAFKIMDEKEKSEENKRNS